MKNISYIILFLLFDSCRSSYVSPSSYEYYEYYDKNNANYYMLMVDEKNDKANLLFTNKTLVTPYNIIWFSGDDRNGAQGSINIKVNNIITVTGNYFKWCKPAEEEITKLYFFSEYGKEMTFLNTLEYSIFFPCKVEHYKDTPILPEIMKRKKGINYKRINKHYHGLVELLAQGKIQEAQELFKSIDIYKDKKR